jgi:hypothetical protein
MVRGEVAQEALIVRVAATPGQRLDPGELGADGVRPAVARRHVDDLTPQEHDAGDATVAVRSVDIAPDAASFARTLLTWRPLAGGKPSSRAPADRPGQAVSDLQRPLPGSWAERMDARQALVICATTHLPCAVRDERVDSRACLDQHLNPISICRSRVETAARRPADLTPYRPLEKGQAPTEKLSSRGSARLPVRRRKGEDIGKRPQREPLEALRE